MPIKVEDILKYEDYEKDEIQIIKFLEKQKEMAFTYMEIYCDIKPKRSSCPNGTWEDCFEMLARGMEVNIFHDTLKKMYQKKEINIKVVRGIEYYYLI